MKYGIFFLVFVHFQLSYNLLSAQIGIGTTNPDASAKLQIDATTQGVLLPRLTLIQMQAISNPASGLLVYCTNCNPVGFRFYNGSAWSELMPQRQLALFNNSSTINANSWINWSDQRYNSITAANMVWSSSNSVCTLSNGIYLVEWGTTRVTSEYTGIDLYLNDALYRGSSYYSRAENGGGTNWGGNSRRYAIIDASSSSQVIKFKTDASWALNIGGELKIEKIN